MQASISIGDHRHICHVNVDCRHFIKSHFRIVSTQIEVTHTLLLSIFVRFSFLRSHVCGNNHETNALFFFGILNISLGTERVIAAPPVLGIYFLGVNDGYFEIDSAKLDNVSDTQHVSLVVRKEILQNLVWRSLLAHNKPHSLFQVDVVLLVLKPVLHFLSLNE